LSPERRGAMQKNKTHSPRWGCPNPEVIQTRLHNHAQIGPQGTAVRGQKERVLIQWGEKPQNNKYRFTERKTQCTRLKAHPKWEGGDKLKGSARSPAYHWCSEIGKWGWEIGKPEPKGEWKKNGSTWTDRNPLPRFPTT